MRTTDQQITDFLCASAYESVHGFMVYICTSDFSMSCSVQQTLHSPFAVTWKLTIKLGVVWPAISYFVPLIACIGGTELSW